MKLLYTSFRNTHTPKNKLYFKNYYFNKTNKNLLRKKVPLKNNRTTPKLFTNTSVMLNFNNRNSTRKHMRMFVPFSKTRKCGGCFRH